MNCFLCGIELHQVASDMHRPEPSFPVCGHPTERICLHCEKGIERKPLPKTSIGILAANPRGRIYDRLASTPLPKVQHAELLRGELQTQIGEVTIRATFTPA